MIEKKCMLNFFLKSKKRCCETFTIINTSLIERLKHRIETSKPKDVASNVASSAIGNDCSICFETMSTGEVFSQCLKTCKNYFHEECINLSNEYLHKVLNELDAEHFNSGNADVDLYCAIKSKIFIQGRGFFSKLIVEIRKKLNLHSIETTAHD